MRVFTVILFSWKLFLVASNFLKIATTSSSCQKFFFNSRKEEKYSNSEKVQDFRKSNCSFNKIAKVSLKPFSSEKYINELYTQLFKDLKPMLSENGSALSAKVAQI